MKFPFSICFCLVLINRFCHGDTEGAIRLKTDSGKSYEGMVELYHNNQWGSFTPSYIWGNTPSVVCRHLDLGDKQGFEIDRYYVTTLSPRIFYGLDCDEDETNITNCRFSLRRSVNYYSYGAGVLCKEFNSSNLRLHGGIDVSEGKVQFLFKGQWKGLCEDTLDFDVYNVACRQLGYRVVESFGRDMTSVIHDNGVLPFTYDCYNRDTGFESCYTRAYSFVNCTDSGRISVKCRTFEVTDIRLVGGNKTSEGRVEIFDGEWKTVCSKGLSSEAADAICRQKGWRKSLSSGEHGADVVRPIITYQFFCDKDETNINNCSVVNKNYSCSHENDVFLLCSACDSLPIPDNGIKSSSGTFHGDFSRFDCKAEFTLIGSAVRECQINNTWSGIEANCVRECERLVAPTNGSVLSPPVSVFQATVKFSCNTGFDLIGMMNRTCMENGEWNGSNPTCKVKDCGYFDAPMNGSVEFSSGTYYKSVAVIKCDPGFFIVGDNRRTCNDGGNWTGFIPFCIESKGCVTPTELHEQENTGILYGGIATAFIFGILVGVATTVCIMRQRLIKKIPSSTVQGPIIDQTRATSAPVNQVPGFRYVNGSESYSSVASTSPTNNLNF